MRDEPAIVISDAAKEAPQQSQAAAYSYKEAGRLLGQNEKARLFVRENGTVGSIQKIILAI